MWAGYSSGLLVNCTKTAIGSSVREAVPRGEKAGWVVASGTTLLRNQCVISMPITSWPWNISFKYQHLENSRMA